jgi:hypothetical protein
MYFQPTRIFYNVDTASDSCTSGRVLVYDMFNREKREPDFDKQHSDLDLAVSWSFSLSTLWCFSASLHLGMLVLNSVFLSSVINEINKSNFCQKNKSTRVNKSHDLTTKYRFTNSIIGLFSCTGAHISINGKRTSILTSTWIYPRPTHDLTIRI